MISAVENGRTMRRPGGRTARVRSAVHDAVVELLDEVPWESITVPLVAERSGVHQATLYRRWGTTSAILNDALSARFASAAPVPDTGSLREDLSRYAVMVASDLEKVLVPLVLRAAILEIRPGEPREPTPAFLERTRELQAMLDRAAARGEVVPTLDELLEVLVAPIYFRALFTAPMPASEVDHLVDRLLGIVACRPSKA
jgi:AcrR family transcriptional regulator